VIGRARVLLAPLRFGAGIKGKLLEAMKYGTPSVTTSVGAEAMHGAMPWNGAVADTAGSFGRAAVTLYTDREAWETAQRNGTRILENLFVRQLHLPEFFRRISALREGLERHRQRNFIGSMLMHHTMRSTEFMGRWIELKNARRTDT